MKNTNQNQDQNAGTDLPPLFKTWQQLYTFVLVELVLCIVVFYGITVYFSK